MARQKIKVLHIDTEKSWRGGQQQAAYLHEALSASGISSGFVCQPDSVLLQKLDQKKLKFYPIKIRYELDIFAALKIAGICKDEKYNILHCHSAHALTIGILVKYLYRNIKLIAVRRVDFHIRSRWKYNNRFVSAIVCISDKIRDILLDDAIGDEKLVTIKSGIDIHKFDDAVENGELKKEFDISETDVVVGTIAAFVGHKDYNNFIEAAKRVLDKNKNVKFIAVGDGELLDAMKAKAESITITDNFIFTGYRNDIGALLRSFDIFVMASKREGLGTSILDAQAVGLPVIVTNAGGMPEIVEDGITGKIVEARNPVALSEAIIELVTDTDKRKVMGLNGKESVKRFDINITVAKNIELYEKLLREL